MSLTARELRRSVQKHGARFVTKQLKKGLKKGHIKPDDLSVRDLAEALITSKRNDRECVGPSWVRRLGPQKSGGITLLESTSGVQSSNFNDINGQIFYNKLLEGYQQEEFIAPSLMTEYNTDLNGEKIAGIQGIIDDIAKDPIKEGMPYPQTGFGPEYIETPQTDKYGLIISITKETIFFDRTHQILARASSVGEVLARRKEKRCWDVILGIVNNYKRNGTTYNTYLTSGGWINKRTGVTLTDWNTIDASEQLFADLVDPNTGEPIVVSPSTIIHMPARTHLFRQILRATTLETTSNSAVERRIGPNTLDPYTLVQSKFAYRRIIDSGVSASNAKDWWLFGNPKKAFYYAQNWPVTVTQAPNNSEAEFLQDIAFRFKASERGVPFVYDPRQMQLVINS